VLHAEVKKVVRDIRAAADTGGFDHPKAHVSWTGLDLDSEGIDEVAELLARVVGELLEIRARVAGRQSEAGAGSDAVLGTEVAIMHFERPRRRQRGRS
jgi:hypothetical protein